MKKPNTEHLESTQYILDDLRFIYSHTDDLTTVASSPTLEEWFQFVRDVLPYDNILSDSIVSRTLDEIEKLKDFSVHFPANSRVCFSIIPCDNFGTPLTHYDVKAGDHIAIIIVPKDHTSMTDYFKIQKLLYEFMPAEIRNNCSFDVGSNVDSEEDKVRIVTSCAKSLQNLRQLFDNQRNYKFS